MVTSSILPPGARVGKYRILAHIATGGMGTVYKARDEESSQIVALKVLPADLATHPILLERFRREARAAGALVHRNIVALLEAAEADGHHYLAMEFIRGVDLSEYIRRQGKVDPEESRRIIIQACKALEHAFEQGIIHRDIKPSNFLLANEQGRCRVKLADLGLSRMINEEDFRVTRAGTTVGTVDYMAPEQARDSALADVRSDIYSLGCTLYHMMAGRPPFAEGGIGERVYKHIAADPPDIRKFNDAVPPGLWTVVRRMLAKHPDDRFQTPAEVIEALRSIPGEITQPAEGAEGTEPSDSTIQARPTVLTASTPSPEPPRLATPRSPIAMPVAPTTVPEEEEEPSPLPSPAPARPEPAKKRKRQTTLSDLNTLSEVSDALGVTADQRQTASKQYSHAQEIIRSGGDANYAIQLLLSCCKVDPANVLYRKMLREVVRDHLGRKKAGWFSFATLGNLSSRSKLRTARKAGDHRKVLYDGEELLSRNPGDVGAQLEMAGAANDLGLPTLAVWLLEEARVSAPDDMQVLRALAQIYQSAKRYNHAIAVWDLIRKANPDDHEAGAKIKELAVAETLSRGNYRK